MREEIFKISKDIIRVKDLLSMAKERVDEIIVILPRDKPYKLLEEYYEVVVQLITALMYSDGFKTLSHVSLIEYLSKNYSGFEISEISIIESMRKLRHGTVYYGKKISEDFLINNEGVIKKVISLLIKILDKKIKVHKNE